MTARKAKRITAKAVDEIEVEEAEVASPDTAIAESVSRALEAARLADDAAEDIEALRKEHEAFIEKIESRTRKLSALAIGASAGAAIAMVLSGLVYFRSVADLREAAAFQSEVLTKLVEQTTAFQSLIEESANQQGQIQETVIAQADRLSAQMNDMAQAQAGVTPEMLATLEENVAAQMDTLRADMTATMADLDLSLSQKMSSVGGSGGMSDAAMVDLARMIEELKTAVGTATAAAAAPRSSQQSSTSSSNRSSSSDAAPRRTTRPASRPAAPAEPNPFTFP